MRITSDGRVGIGTTNPLYTLDVNSGTADVVLRLTSLDTNCFIDYRDGSTTPGYVRTGAVGDDLTLWAGNSERGRIDSSGRLLVGTSTSITMPDGEGGTQRIAQLQLAGNSFATTLQANSFFNPSGAGAGTYSFTRSNNSNIGSHTVVNIGNVLGSLQWSGSDGTNYIRAAQVTATVDGTPGTNDMPGRLVFSTTASGASSPTERMRINNDGIVLIGKASTAFNVVGFSFNPVGLFAATRSGGETLLLNREASDGTIALFRRSNTTVGSISVTTTTTAYNTSSDYRLKENVVPLTGAIDRLQQIPVHRFNFIADPDTVVDGFIAHEAQEVVPECVTGTKDEVDEDGNPVYQGIDQSKLVPLLTAALQEALAKIEDLEGRLTAAGL
jgi:hypothetical protein